MSAGRGTAGAGSEGRAPRTAGLRVAPAGLAQADLGARLFAASPAALYCASLAGEVLEANGALAELLGCSEARDLVAADVRSFFRTPGTHERLAAELAARGAVRGFTVELVRCDGGACAARVDAAAIDIDGVAAYAAAVFPGGGAARPHAEPDFRTIFETSLDAITINALADGKYVDVNAEFIRLSGYRREEVIGRTAAEVSIWADPKQMHFALRELKHRGIVRNLEADFRTKDGSTVSALFSAECATIGAERCIVSIVRDVRDRKAAAKAHKELAALVESSDDAIVAASLDGAVATWNPAAERLFGYSLDEMRGRPLVELAAPATVGAMARLIDKIAGGGSVRRFETLLRRRDGSLVDVSLTMSAVRDDRGGIAGVSWIARDITERKRAADAIAESERRYRALFEESNDVIFLTDPNGVLIDVNPAGVALLGCASKEELLRSGTGETFYERPEMHRELVAAVTRSGELRDVDLVLRRRDGRMLKTVLNATLVRDAGGEIAGVRGSLRDMTEKSRLQEELLHAQRLDAVGRLAGGVAHDFNNLLTVIRSSAGLALAALSAEDPLRASLEEIDEAARRSAELTGQLLAFARRQVISPEILNPNEVIDRLERMLRRVITERIELETRLAPDLWPVRADRGQLEQVVMNLAVNARDAMPEGGRITIETRNVTVAGAADRPFAARPGPYAEIRVSDTGVGMTEEVRSHAFEPFFTTKGAAHGTGLGLAICYGIVTQSGGHIDVESEPGRGAAFRILLPRVQEAHGRPPAPEERRSLAGAETILVLEDEPVVRRLTVRVLRARGYRVIEAASATEAVAIAAGPEGEGLALLVSDVVLPKTNGGEAAERIRERHPGLKVIFISGYSDDPRMMRAVAEGSAAFLQKPFTPDALLSEVRRMLDGG